MHAQRYYAEHFPRAARALARALAPRDADARAPLGTREFAKRKGDVMCRWIACEDAAALARLAASPGVTQLEVGASYAHPMAHHRKLRARADGLASIPRARELVLDVDLTDYDARFVDLRRCDQGWPLVALAVRVLLRVLRDAFGFERTLVVYSGRRGAHIWVFDERARALDREARTAIARFCAPRERSGLGWAALASHPSWSELHSELVQPFLAAQGLEPWSRGGVGLLDTGAQRRAFVQQVHPDALDAIGGLVRRAAHGRAAFDIVRAWVRRRGGASAARGWLGAQWALCGPLIDAQVSCDPAHLLRMPFSVHSKTGRVAVPVDECALDALALGPDALSAQRVVDEPDGRDAFDAAVRALDERVAAWRARDDAPRARKRARDAAAA
jgi:DNA primase small subunit